MTKVVLLGAGYCANVHMTAYTQIKDVEIVGIVDEVVDKAKTMAEKIGANYYTDFDEALNKEDCNLVDICIPIYKHAEFAIKAAKAGKNIFIEKPVTLSLEEANDIIKAVEENKVKAMVGHCVRFWPEYIKAREIAHSGELGKILYAYSERHLSFPTWPEKEWAFNEEYSGGAAVDLHCHDLDYLNWIFGKPSVVMAQGVYNASFGGFIQMATTVGYENGMTGLAQGGWAYHGKFPFTVVVRILCEKGTIDWMLRAGTNIEERGSSSALVVYKEDGSIVKPEIEDVDPYLAECRYLTDCIENDKSVERSTLVDAREAVKTCLAARESAKRKIVVNLTD